MQDVNKLFIFAKHLKPNTMTNQEIIESLNRCIYLAKGADITYIERELTKVSESLLDEWNTSDYYAQQISQVLNLEETFKNLNNIKIR